MENLLQFIQTVQNISLEFVEQAKIHHPDGIYLYGAGHHMRFCVRFMQKYSVKIKAIIDTNHSGEYQNIPIIKFSDFLASSPTPDSWFVISAPSAQESIIDAIVLHFPRENIFSFETQLYTEYIPDIEYYRNYLLKYWDEFVDFYDSLSDEKSKATLISVLKGRVSGDISYFHHCYDPIQYYTPQIIHFSVGEVMVELGANDGETLKEFLCHCPDFRSAYCFEPDTNCLSKLNDIAENVRGGTIHVIPKGAWDCATVLEFCSDGECAGDAHILSEFGGTAAFRIETAAVDKEVDEPISFMKMDIEGAELRALHGAKRQIHENHPKLAICVYHKIDDILNIWNYLRELVPEYRFFLRHHNADCGTETVLYATVDEVKKVDI